MGRLIFMGASLSLVNAIRSPAMPDPAPTENTPPKRQVLLTNSNYSTQWTKIHRWRTRWKLFRYPKEMKSSCTSVPSYCQPKNSNFKRCSNKVVMSLPGLTQTCPGYLQTSPLTDSMYYPPQSPFGKKSDDSIRTDKRSFRNRLGNC